MRKDLWVLPFGSPPMKKAGSPDSFTGTSPVNMPTLIPVSFLISTLLSNINRQTRTIRQLRKPSAQRRGKTRRGLGETFKNPN